MKQILGVYIFITFIVAGYSILTSSNEENFSEGHFSNALMWPVGAFDYFIDSEIDGDSLEDWNNSLSNLIDARDDSHEQLLAMVAVNQIFLLDYVESHPELTIPDVETLVNQSNAKVLAESDKIKAFSETKKKWYVESVTARHKNPEFFAKSININDQTIERIAQQLDGLDYDELIDAGHNSLRKIVKISKSLPEYSSPEDCFDGLIKDYRKELGQDALVRYDQLQEFNEVCGLPKEEW